MQMGRWFGYHSGYADLCRLYTTLGLCQSYRYITEATAELREEFEVMSAMGETPKSFGLKVRTHPALLVTSPMKMRTAHDIRVSFSGTAPETVTFFQKKMPERITSDVYLTFSARSAHLQRLIRPVRLENYPADHGKAFCGIMFFPDRLWIGLKTIILLLKPIARIRRTLWNLSER